MKILSCYKVDVKLSRTCNNGFLKYFSLLFLISLFSSPGFSQQQLDPQYLLRTNTEYLLSQSIEWRSQSIQERQEAIRLANENGWPINIVNEDGSVSSLIRLVNGQPEYYTTNNLETAEVSNTEPLWFGGASGHELEGVGMTLGIWDSGSVLENHQEFGNRVSIEDGPTPNGTTDHATHVAGTLIASGTDPLAKGMAPQANLLSYDWNSDNAEMAEEAANGLLISNHSYGSISGWRTGNWYDPDGPNELHWWGDPDIDQETDWKFGFYSTKASIWDDIAFNAPYYLIVKSAGNNRNDNGSGEHYVRNTAGNWVLSNDFRNPDGDYDCIPTYGTAKNILTVGAITAAENMSNFSGWGPTDDGRIKPDVVAKGVSVYSSLATNPSAYDSWNGTSMASPGVAGSLLLLQEHSLNLSGDYLRSATIKGLVIHTAKPLSDGPSYEFGWGLIDTEAAANFLTENISNELALMESSLSDGEIKSFEYFYDGQGDIKVTLSWTDPPGTPHAPELNNPDIKLVNDLDIKLTDSDNVSYFPYVLDPSNPSFTATTGNNIRDNVEVIFIEEGTLPIGELTLEILHKGSLSDVQDFSLIVSGIESISNDCPDVTACCHCPHYIIEDDILTAWMPCGEEVWWYLDEDIPLDPGFGGSQSYNQSLPAGSYTLCIADPENIEWGFRCCIEVFLDGSCGISDIPNAYIEVSQDPFFIFQYLNAQSSDNYCSINWSGIVAPGNAPPFICEYITSDDVEVIEQLSGFASGFPNYQCLTVTNDLGFSSYCIDKDGFINDLPKIIPSLNGFNLTFSLDPNFGNLSGLNSIEWDYGDFTFSIGELPSEVDHTYVEPGTYLPSVTIIFDDGLEICITWTVIVIDPCPPDWPICQCPLNYDPVCTPDGQLFTNSCFAECAGYTNYFPSLDGSCDDLCEPIFDYNYHLAPRTFDFTYLTYASDIQYFTAVREDDPNNTLQVVEVNDLSDLVYTCPTPGQWTFCFYYCDEDVIVSLDGGNTRSTWGHEGFSACCDLNVCCITVCADQDPEPVFCLDEQFYNFSYNCFSYPTIYEDCFGGIFPLGSPVKLFDFSHIGGEVDILVSSFATVTQAMALKVYDLNDPYQVSTNNLIYCDQNFCTSTICNLSFSGDLEAGNYLVVVLSDNPQVSGFSISFKCFCEDRVSGDGCDDIVHTFKGENGSNLMYEFEIDPLVSVYDWEIDGELQGIDQNNIEFSFLNTGSSYEVNICALYIDWITGCIVRCCRTFCIFHPFDCSSIEYDWLAGGLIKLSLNEAFSLGSLEWILDNHVDGPTLIGAGNNLEIDISQFPINGEEYLISARYGTSSCWLYCCIAVPIPPTFGCTDIVYIVTNNGLGAEFEREDGLSGNWLVIEENGDTVDIAFDVPEASYYNPIGGIREVCWWQQNPDGSFEYCCRTFCCFDSYLCDYVFYNEVTFDSDEVDFDPDITTGQYWTVTNTETGETEEYDHEPNLIIEYPGDGFYEVCGYFINSCGELQWCCYTRCVAPPSCGLWYSPPVVLPLGGIEVEFIFPSGITVDSIVITGVDDPDFELIISDIPLGTITLVIELPDYGDYDFCYYYTNDVFINSNQSRAVVQECCRRIYLNPCTPIWYAPVGSGDWVYRIENQGDEQVHQWEIADEDGNVIDVVNGNNIVYDFGSSGEYIITPIIIIPDDCSLIRGCSERLCLTPVFDCDVIFQRPTPVFLQGGVLRYTFDFIGPSGAEHIQWYVDENPNMRAEGQTVFFDFGPEFFGTHVTISVIWFDGHCWRVCCVRICIADPFACDVIDFDPAPLPEGLQLDFSLPTNFEDVYWELHLTDGTTIATGEGNQWSHLLTEFDNEELVISVTYFDPITGCRKMCCELLCLPDPLACEEIIVQPLPFGYSGGDYGYSAQLLAQNATDISWYWHDADGSILGSGTGSVAEYIFDSGFEGEVFITFIYREGNCWRVCCKRICVRNPWNCGNILWSIGGIGQNTVTYDFDYEDIPQDAEEIEWEILDENGNVFSSGTGSTFSESLVQGENYIIVFRYYDPVLNCRVICCRRLCVLDPFACGDIIVYPLPVPGGPVYIAELINPDAEDIYWQVDEDLSNNQTGGNTFEVDFSSYPPGNYNITVRYRIGDCWFMCCRQLCISPPLNCNLLSAESGGGLEVILNNPENLPIEEYFVFDQSGEHIETLDGSAQTYELPVSGSYTFCGYYFINGCWSYCCFGYSDCDSEIHCDDFIFTPVGNQGQVEIGGQLSGGAEIDSIWVVLPDNSSIWIPGPISDYECPIPGNYQFCFYYVNECGFVDFCCVNYCADNFDYPCLIGPAIPLSQDEYSITYEGDEEVSYWEIDGEQTGHGLEQINVIIDDPGQYEICVIRISLCGVELERCCVTYCLGGGFDCDLPLWEVFEDELVVSFTQLNSDTLKVYGAEDDELLDVFSISGENTLEVNLVAQGNYYFCFSYINACGQVDYCCTDVICVGVQPVCPVFEAEIFDLSVDFSFVDQPSGTAMWDFGDGNTVSGNQVTHVYAEGGSYTACYTIENDCGSCTYCETIVVFPEGAIALAYGKKITRPNRTVEVPLYVASGTTLARGSNLSMRIEDQSVAEYLGFNSVSNFTFSNVGETSPGSGEYSVLLGTIGEPITISTGDTLGYFRFSAIGEPGDTTAIEFIRSESNTIEDNSAPPQFISPILIDGCIIISLESVSVAGKVTSWPGPEMGINNAEVIIRSGASQIGSTFTGADGNYAVSNLVPPSGSAIFSVEKQAAEPFQALAGQVQAAAVTRHINLKDFVNQGQYIAADFNCDGQISVGDVLSIMQAAFNMEDETLTPECREREWVFVPKVHEVSPVNNDNWHPFAETVAIDFPLTGDEGDFYGVRKGDVLRFSDFGRSAPVVFYTSDTLASEGEYMMEVRTDRFTDITSFGFTLEFDTSKVEFMGFDQDFFRGSPFFHDSLALEKGSLSLGWVDFSGNGIDLDDGSRAFAMRWGIKEGGSMMSTLIQDAHATTAIGTKSDLEVIGVRFVYDHVLSSSSVPVEARQFALHQNIPNPFRGSTIIPFELPERGEVVLEIYDSVGKIVYRYSGHHSEGMNQVMVEDIRPGGNYFYRLESNGHSAVKKMIIIGD